MSFVKVVGQVGGEVVDQYDSNDGFASPITFAIAQAINTGVSGFTGYATVTDGVDSIIAPCTIAAGVQVIGTAIGATTKFALSVVGGKITITNNTGAEAVVTFKLS